jgi:hypothetical protein
MTSTLNRRTTVTPLLTRPIVAVWGPRRRRRRVRQAQDLRELHGLPRQRRQRVFWREAELLAVFS